MLEAMTKEYAAICTHLIRTGCRRKRDFLFVEKEVLEGMLDRNKYETARNKLKLWKQLGWIDADKDRLTRRVYDKESSGYVNCVKLSLEVYRALMRMGL